MEELEEIEDLVGEVKYTDSQKSVATSNMYSTDFTDSSSDKCNSIGKKTYVIETDDSDDSQRTFLSHNTLNVDKTNNSIIPIKSKSVVKSNPDCDMTEANQSVIKTTNTSLPKCSIAQEIFTQTSKTIIELAESERILKKAHKTLETQTSFISIVENTVQYTIQINGTQEAVGKHFQCEFQNDASKNIYSIDCNSTSSSFDNDSSKYFNSDGDQKSLEAKSESSSKTIVTTIPENEETENNGHSSYNNSNQLDKCSKSDSDIDDDSLNMCNDYQKSVLDDDTDKSEVINSIDNDVSDLYKRLTERMNLKGGRKSEEVHYNTLTTLTEESTIQRDSFTDITPGSHNIAESDVEDKYLLFVNNAGVKVKVLPQSNKANTRENGFEPLKLPPIRNNQSCPTSPHLNFLFSGNVQSSVNDSSKEGKQRTSYSRDRWEIGTKDLAAGEGPLISDRSERRRPNESILPPIRAETHPIRNYERSEKKNCNNSRSYSSSNKPTESISIKEKITELKMTNHPKNWPHMTFATATECRTSRSGSPESRLVDDSRLGDVAERGCEALCQELLKRLKSSTWLEVSDTLEELPRVMEKFWGVISENRIADLIRQVNVHIESPRTQVARNACSTVAAILKNTNYTKKPDFYEAVTSLLAKTGSFSRPVRRAANMALDGVVTGVELPHAVTALCVHGTTHKSPLVRCASARLLVVSCALAGGGRELLRARPPSAACARRHALRSLAALLEDKNTETRKYAERLYSMLRPLSNFEAYYLTDVEVEVATRQMKKFDQLLLCGPPVENR